MPEVAEQPSIIAHSDYAEMESALMTGHVG